MANRYRPEASAATVRASAQPIRQGQRPARGQPDVADHLFVNGPAAPHALQQLQVCWFALSALLAGISRHLLVPHNSTLMRGLVYAFVIDSVWAASQHSAMNG